MRRLAAPIAALAFTLALAAPTLACGGLIGPNGAVNLLRTTTLAGYHDGDRALRHLVRVRRRWRRLRQHHPAARHSEQRRSRGRLDPAAPRARDRPTATASCLFFGSAGAADSRAQVLQQVRIDALDITILKGGGAEIGVWAREHGFSLPPDAPEVLDFYANRSPIFMAASFDADAAAERGQAIGDGTPVHLTIPTDNPWVPLRILALGKSAAETVQADVYLLTDDRPALLPAPGSKEAEGGLRLAHSAGASTELLTDLRTDKGMEWVPQGAWLTKIEIDTAAVNLRFDLAIDACGSGQAVAARCRLRPVWAAARTGLLDTAVGDAPGTRAGRSAGRRLAAGARKPQQRRGRPLAG